MQGLMVSQKPESLEDDDGDDVQKWRLSLVKTMEMSDSDALTDLF